MFQTVLFQQRNVPRQRRSSFGKMATTTSKLLSYDHIYENFFVHKKKGKKPCRKMTLGKSHLSLSLLFRSQFSFFSPLTKNSSMGHNRLKNLIKQATYMFQIYKYVSRISTSISIFGYHHIISSLATVGCTQMVRQERNMLCQKNIYCLFGTLKMQIDLIDTNGQYTRECEIEWQGVQYPPSPTLFGPLHQKMFEFSVWTMDLLCRWQEQ